MADIDGPINNYKSAADTARCAAQFSSDYSMAAGIQRATNGHVSKNNIMIDAVFGSDAATVSNLITGPNRGQALGSRGISKGVGMTAKVVGNLPNPATTGLATMGTATVKETVGGTAFVSRWTDATIATSLFGKAGGKMFAIFSDGKLAWDVGTYGLGWYKCH